MMDQLTQGYWSIREHVHLHSQLKIVKVIQKSEEALKIVNVYLE